MKYVRAVLGLSFLCQIPAESATFQWHSLGEEMVGDEAVVAVALSGALGDLPAQRSSPPLDLAQRQVQEPPAGSKLPEFN